MFSKINYPLKNILFSKKNNYITKRFLSLKNFNNNNKLINPPKYIDHDKITNLDEIDSNYGLKEFIKKTYLWTGGGITGSIGLSLIGSNMFEPQIIYNSLVPIFGIGSLMGICGAIGIGFTKYSTHTKIIKMNNTISNYKNNPKILYSTDSTGRIISTYNNNNDNNITILYSTNSAGRIISYCSLIIGNGIIMVPLFMIYPNAVLPAFIASSSVFGGATIYSLTRKTGELDSMGPVLYGGLSGLVGVSLLGLGSDIFFGSNWFGNSAHLINLYGGIPLFTGLIAYDTHKSIQKYQSGDPDHLGCSTELYLDFINLFVRFLEIVAKIQANSNKNDN